MWSKPGLKCRNGEQLFFFSFSALLFPAWQSICWGSRPECRVLILSHPANICGGHTNARLTHRQYCVSVRQNIRLDKRLWWIILTKSRKWSGLHQRYTQSIILGQSNDHRSIDLCVTMRIVWGLFPFSCILVFFSFSLLQFCDCFILFLCYFSSVVSLSTYY